MARKALALAFLLLPLACPTSRSLETDARAPCPSLGANECARARGLVAASASFDDLIRDYVIGDPSIAPLGRGLAQTAAGGWNVLPATCADRAPNSPASKLDPSAIDFASVGITVDGAWVATDAELAPLLADRTRAHVVRLVAIALVRDLALPVVDASPAVTRSKAGCACGAATHFAGQARSGGMLAYTIEAHAGDARGTSLDFVRAALSNPRAKIAIDRAGGLEIVGLDAVLTGRAVRPLAFNVKAPVPIAIPVHPLADVCGLAFPEPDVSPQPLDFGDAPYGTPSTRALHVVNRASIDLQAILGARTFAIPPHGAIDLPLTWTPDGDALGCEIQSREEVILFLPGDLELAVSPKKQQAHVLERVRTGRPTVARAERLDTGDPRRPSYAATTRDWTCPRDFVRASCRADRPQCADGARACTSDGYAVSAVATADGCHFGCTGPSAARGPQFCRFDAIMECRLACPH